MNGAPSVPIVALVTHARHVAAIDRERFATAVRRESLGRAFTLETCHRVEVYLGNADDAAHLAPTLPEGAQALTGEQAVHHAMTVAVGRDSVVVGEDQILHQLRTSVERADREREAELAALWRRLPDLEPEARDAIEGMTRQLADRLLREPLERLGRDTDGRHRRAIRDLFAL